MKYDLLWTNDEGHQAINGYSITLFYPFLPIPFTYLIPLPPQILPY